MQILSVKYIKLLVLIILTLSMQSVLASNWPIQNKIDLSSGFGDFRANRFHTGIDLRTGGRTGIKIYAPVSGFIKRVRTSYTGYGKGLYLKGDDGYIYVFGHLSNFEARVDSLIRATQRESMRYFQDLNLQDNQIRYNEGDLIGYSGQTGTGAPHIHFEKRTEDNKPLNPLANGFTLDDQIKPAFTKIGFKLLDDHSLFDNALREMEFTPTYDNRTQSFILDTLLYFHRPVGVFVGAFDQMSRGGMKQSIYKMTLLIDGAEFYQIVFDTLDFDYQRSVNYRYEYKYAVTNDTRVLSLYESNDDIVGSSKNNSGGKLEIGKNLSYGKHEAKILAEDAFGNTQTLQFSFLFGPEDYLYPLDSQVVENQNHYFYFTPPAAIEKMQIDSVVAFINRGKKWAPAIGASIEQVANNQIRCNLPNIKTSTTTVRLIAFSESAIIQDNIFCGIVPKGKLSSQLEYEIIEDGILINLSVTALQSAESRIELYAEDKLLDVYYPQMFDMDTYRCFIPALPKYKKIDKIGYAMSKAPEYPLKYRDSLHIYLVGDEDNETITYENINFVFDKANFEKPRFIEIEKRFYVKNNERLVSDIVELKPKAFICKSDFKVTYSVKKRDPFYERTGISWFNDDKNEWVWLNTERDGYNLSTASTGGGTFAVLYDLEPPVISKLNIIDKRTYPSNHFKITFEVDDLLSGIKDDLAFMVRLNKEWMIPEYDPESKKFVAFPEKPLETGNYHLGIEVVDAVGNKTEQYLNFYIKNRR